jgi:hypothetical protein
MMYVGWNDGTSGAGSRGLWESVAAARTRDGSGAP